MAQTALVKTTLPNPNLLTGISLVWAACDATNGNSIVCTGTEIVLVYNSTTGALTFAITGNPSGDAYGRVANFSMSVPASIALASAPSVIATPRLGTQFWSNTGQGGGLILTPSSNPATLFVAVLTGT